MAEMTDYFIERELNRSVEPFGRGKRGAYHAPPTCRTCGMKALRWNKVRDKYCLFEGNKRHVCKQKSNTPEGFENVD